MNVADTFALAANAIVPSTAALIKEGLSRSDAAAFRRRLLLRRRRGHAQVRRPTDAIADLVARYDCSQFSFRSIRFYAGQPRPKDWLSDVQSIGRYVADFEADPIVVVESGEVARVDHSTIPKRRKRLIPCADSPDGFLRALTASLSPVFLDDDAERARAETAASIAGGTRYRAFWHALNGVVPLPPAELRRSR